MNKKDFSAVSLTIIIALVILAFYVSLPPTERTVPVVTSTIATDSSQSSGEVTQYFGNAAYGDLNGDGKVDAAYLVTQQGGGSGTFYYVGVMINNGKGGYVPTNTIFLGDRIAPQATQIKNGEVIINYFDRAPTDPMAAAPTIGVSKYFKVTGTTLSAVE